MDDALIARSGKRTTLIPDLLSWHRHLMRFGHNNPGARAGEWRENQVGVYGGSRLIYLAPPPARMDLEKKNFEQWLVKETSKEMSIPDIFRLAAMAHFRFAAIHPYDDVNGRGARLTDLFC